MPTTPTWPSVPGAHAPLLPGVVTGEWQSALSILIPPESFSLVSGTGGFNRIAFSTVESALYRRPALYADPSIVAEINPAAWASFLAVFPLYPPPGVALSSLRIRATLVPVQGTPTPEASLLMTLYKVQMTSEQALEKVLLEKILKPNLSALYDEVSAPFDIESEEPSGSDEYYVMSLLLGLTAGAVPASVALHAVRVLLT